MTLDERIADQMERFEALQQDLIAREGAIDDLQRSSEMKGERATILRTAIERLQYEKEETAARFDAEIAALEGELTQMEQLSDVELALLQAGGGGPDPSGSNETT